MLFSIPYYPTLSLILVHNPITPKIKALASHLLTSSSGRRPGYVPFCCLPHSGGLHKFKYWKVHYCNTVPLQMQNALNTIKLQKFSHQCIQLKTKKKKLSNLSVPASPSCLRHECPDPALVLSPLEKVQIFTFLIPLKM